MYWFSVATILVALVATGSSTAKSPFDNQELTVYFLELFVKYLQGCEILLVENEYELFESLQFGIFRLFERHAKTSKIKNFLVGKIVDVVLNGIDETNDFTYAFDCTAHALANAFEDSTGVVDVNFIKSVEDILVSRFGTEVEERIGEMEEQAVLEV